MLFRRSSNTLAGQTIDLCPLPEQRVASARAFTTHTHTHAHAHTHTHSTRTHARTPRTHARCVAHVRRNSHFGHSSAFSFIGFFFSNEICRKNYLCLHKIPQNQKWHKTCQNHKMLQQSHVLSSHLKAATHRKYAHASMHLWITPAPICSDVIVV